MTFLIILHTVTLFGMDNTKKCHIMQKYQKSHQSKDMTILKIFCDTCWWALTLYSVPISFSQLQATNYTLLEPTPLQFSIFSMYIEWACGMFDVFSQTEATTQLFSTLTALLFQRRTKRCLSIVSKLGQNRTYVWVMTPTMDNWCLWLGMTY